MEINTLATFRRRKYYPYAVGCARLRAGWAKIDEVTMRHHLMAAWDNDEFCEISAADCATAGQIDQWREWCARLDADGGFPHVLYFSTSAPLRVVAFLEDMQF